MDVIANVQMPEQTQSKNHVDANQLSQVFDTYLSKIKVLSLDCFDTILWRKTAAPVDVFHDLEQYPTFQKLGFTAFQRIQAESNARLNNLIVHGTNEATLRDIYLANLPELTETEIKELEAEEIAAEVQACYPFPPIIELMRKAHQHNIKIIIISDTYLKHDQLQYLLKSTLPADVFAAIDTIFASNEFGRSKTNGLFKFVLKNISTPPDAILHIGDNANADLHAPLHYKLHALQLNHNNQYVDEILRMQAASATLLNPGIRYQRSLSSPFRGTLAAGNTKDTAPESIIGYASIGQIMYSFARFIIEEVNRLAQMGTKPKVLFLMRDAYLPSLVCNAITDKPIGKSVRISRFSTHAASFRSQQDIDRYLNEVITSNRYTDIARQLLLPDAVSEPMITAAKKAEDPAHQFIELVHQKHIINMIVKKSSDFRARLVKHLEKEAAIKSGDTLMLVDLGYSGTTQRLLSPIFKDELNIEVKGCYLIALAVPGWKNNRSGLMDASWCDERALRTLVTYIALLEQICTSNEKSVVDYEADGTPIFSETSLSKGQHTKLASIQASCVAFAKHAHAFFTAVGKPFSIEIFRDAAMAELGRFLYLPTENEIKYLESFEFELNLGTKDIFRVFDKELGLTSLRRRGMFFSYMEKNLKSIRMNYPAELRAAGLELAITFMSQHRYGFGFNLGDSSLRQEPLAIIAIKDNHPNQISINAIPTHDGYFSVVIPINHGEIKIGILFGRQYQWLQIESAEIIKLAAYLRPAESQFTEDAWSDVHFNSMNDVGGRLYECTSDTALMMIAPSKIDHDFKSVCRVVFRPITKRAQ